VPRKRPRDFSQAAKLVVDIATGQVEDREPTPEEQGKDPAASAMGRKGGAARAKSMTAEKRSEIARRPMREYGPEDRPLAELVRLSYSIIAGSSAATIETDPLP